ncbi:SDR family NAD(P)-dependent oxidoreductase [Paenibacillus hexagrammi]|uniref:SDR family NAD(P)-dependent oxidoreductase n=1 Tax=Paenibacillus hexagrammi TaxID=2908839 RepID=A0ABY3SFE9_9BACL|nr:SDR family NAD(P)-dependent oxidoreductase [Paenibacillus sp. YPD9-1]UJF32537.1 SDR family NAD(P)-dependent oxidoreductase [Paenibacillus sp. YPD9-1]
MGTEAYIRTALITGASNGIGLELTRNLLKENWEVIGLNRSRFPAQDHLLQHAAHTGKLREYNADLTDFTQLKRALELMKAKERKVDVIFNNAGASLNELRYSRQGREMHFDLQTVAPYIVIMEMKELLKQGELRTVVNTSTSAFTFMKSFHTEALERPESFKKLFGPYAATKLALSLWTKELAPLAAKDGIILRSVDPGGNNTIREGKNSGLPIYLKLAMKWFFPPPSKGASLLYDAALGQHGDATGIFLMKGKVTELKYTDQGRHVLEKVQAIYEEEFKTIHIA